MMASNPQSDWSAREWAPRKIAEGYATIEDPPDKAVAILRQENLKSNRRRKKPKR